MKIYQQPPVTLWPHLALEYMAYHPVSYAQALLYVGRGHDKPADAQPGTVHLELTLGSAGVWFWNEAMAEAEATHTDGIDAQYDYADYYETHLADDCYA